MPDAPDLVEVIRRFHHGRTRAGVRLKYQRMAAGPFEFFRGSDFLYARAWPDLQPRSPGPAVLLCGDLHLENFGAFPTDDGDVRFDINDFDEAAIAPCSFDLVRCATSILLAAETWKLSPTQATGMVLTFLDAYRRTVIEDVRNSPPPEAQPDLGPVARLAEAIRHGSMERLIERQVKRRRDGRWRFRRGDPRLAKASRKIHQAIGEALAQHGLTHDWELLAVAKRFAGIGSLGLRRFQLLVDTKKGLRLVSLKESTESALGPIAEPEQPRFKNEAERAVWAQRVLQGKPTAGLSAVVRNDRAYRLRAVIPDENRSSLNRLQKDPTRLRAAVAIAGRLTARSQFRGCAPAGRGRAGELLDWAVSPALEAVLAAAVRFADWVQRDYAAYLSAFRQGAFTA
jgi:uncharacterized protein (DUF2252 family)